MDLSDSTYTVLPGLVNTHVHLSLELPYLAYYLDKFGDAYRAMVTYRRACEALFCGVTTLRGVGNADTSELAVRNAINKGMFGGPRIISCGSALSPHGGHGYNTPRNVQCSGPDEFIRALRGQLAQGVDQIKLMYTGGLAGAYEGTLDIQMTEEEVKACITVAHNNSKRVAAHLSNNLAIAQAVRLGLDSVEHAYTLSEETARMMAEKGTYLTPTLIVSHCDEYLLKHGSPEWQVRKQKEAAAEHINSCRRAVQAGVTICTGTDLLPSDPIDGTTPTIREAELLVEDVGMSPLQAIKCATYNGADLCGISKQTGSLEAGKIGDFIIVEGKPDQNIRDLRNIRLISKGCRLVKSDLPALTKQNFNPMMAGLPCDGGTFRLW
jgi:imidazolonepropionase-like amidohydrolase